MATYKSLEEKKESWGKRYEARSRGRTSPESLAFLSLRNAQTIEPTTAWTAVSSPSGSTRYSFSHSSGVGYSREIAFKMALA